MIGRATEVVGGLFLLLVLVIRSKGRLSGPYWTWRQQTAFGRGRLRSRAARLHAIIEYASWMWRMRRLR